MLLAALSTWIQLVPTVGISQTYFIDTTTDPPQVSEEEPGSAFTAVVRVVYAVDEHRQGIWASTRSDHRAWLQVDCGTQHERSIPTAPTPAAPLPQFVVDEVAMRFDRFASSPIGARLSERLPPLIEQAWKEGQARAPFSLRRPRYDGYVINTATIVLAMGLVASLWRQRRRDAEVAAAGDHQD